MTNLNADERTILVTLGRNQDNRAFFSATFNNRRSDGLGRKAVFALRSSRMH